MFIVADMIQHIRFYLCASREHAGSAMPQSWKRTSNIAELTASLIPIDNEQILGCVLPGLVLVCRSFALLLWRRTIAKCCDNVLNK